MNSKVDQDYLGVCSYGIQYQNHFKKCGVLAAMDRNKDQLSGQIVSDHDYRLGKLFL